MKSSRTSRSLLITILAVIVLALAAWVYWPQITTTYTNAYIAEQVPADLHGALFLSNDPSGVTTYKATWHGFVETNPASFIPAGTLSPDGTTQVYSAPIASSTVPNPVSQVIYTKSNGKTTPITVGFSPAYLDATHIIYVASNGINVLDLAHHTNTLIFAGSMNALHYTDVAYSPDRTHMVWTDGATRQTIVAHVSPNSYKPLGVFADVRAGTITNDALYAVRQMPTGIELWRYAFDGSSSQKVLTFPKGLNILYILL